MIDRKENEIIAELPLYALLLRSGKKIKITPNGRSMHPILDGYSDTVSVEPLNEFPKKNDLLLYISHGILVLHRVYTPHPDRGSCDMLGDGNTFTEKDIPIENIYGKAFEITRNGKTFPVTNFWYKLYVGLWRAMGYKHRKRYLKILYAIARASYKFRKKH